MAIHERPSIGSRINVDGTVYVITSSHDGGSRMYGHNEGKAWRGWLLEAYPEIAGQVHAANMAGKQIKGAMRDPDAEVGSDGHFPEYKLLPSHPIL